MVQASTIVRVGLLVKLCLPVVATVILIFFSVLPWGVTRIVALELVVAIISVYYWGIYRPDLMPVGAAFLIGLVVDLLGGGVFGLNAMLLVVIQWVAIGQRRALMSKTFMIGWLGYLLISAGAMTIAWLISSVFYGDFLEYTSVIIAYVTGALIYPAVALLLWRVQQIARPV